MRTPSPPFAGAIIAFFVAASGCGSPAPADPCVPSIAASDGTPFCQATADGWILQGVRWENASAQRIVLLVHGLNEDHQSYGRLVQDLRAHNLTVVAFDSRGHGKSVARADAPDRTAAQFGAADFAAMENDLATIVPTLPLDPLTIVGASIGANEALRWAADHPAQTDLVLLSPGLDYHGLRTEGAAQEFHGLIDFVASHNDAYAEQTVTRLAQVHTGAEWVQVWDQKGHGTQMLDAQGRAHIVEWISKLS